ncbi:MAG: hypothetical protein NTW86_24155, partial [Candidatus Sumerlaeota bacterium]|nr:hypothetical protein [Candidatus Sumerlaeota bacterium]
LWRPDGNVPPRMVLHWFRRRLDWFARSVRAGGRRARIRPTELAFCPSNSVLRRYLGDLLSEAIEGYPLNGLILQSDGLPHSLASERRGCFCRLCREEARESELDLDDLLGESPPPEAVEAWDAWRIRSARETMAYFAQRGHKARQRLLLLCRTASTKPEDSETDDEEEGSPERLSLRLWRPWVQMGAVEGLALEGLPSDRERFEETLEHNLASWPDETLLFPGLRSADSAELAERIEVVRSLPMTGFLSEWTGDSTEEAADQLASTCLAPPSLVAEEHPLRSAANLLAEVARLAPADSGISEFLTDILAFAREPSGVSEIEALDAMVDNVRGLEARILGGQVDFGAEERRALHRLSQAKRLARLASHYAGI